MERPAGRRLGPLGGMVFQKPDHAWTWRSWVRTSSEAKIAFTNRSVSGPIWSALARQ